MIFFTVSRCCTGQNTGEPVSSISPRRTMPVIILIRRNTSEPADYLQEGIEKPDGPHVLSFCSPAGELRIPRGPPDSHSARAPSGSGCSQPVPTVGNAGSISRRSHVRMPTGTRYQQSPRTISDTSTVQRSHSLVTLKTQFSPTLNSSDAVTTMSIIMDGSLVICRRKGNRPLRSSQ